MWEKLQLINALSYCNVLACVDLAMNEKVYCLKNYMHAFSIVIQKIEAQWIVSLCFIPNYIKAN